MDVAELLTDGFGRVHAGQAAYVRGVVRRLRDV